MALEIEDHIRVRAYHLWEANGRPEGRDLEFWEQARQAISERGQVASKRRATRPPTGDQTGTKAAKRNGRSARTRTD